MGIVDSIFFKIHCPKCGNINVAEAHQSGSSYDLDSWGSLRGYDDFYIEIEEKGIMEEPRIKSAKCRKCGIPADIEIATFAKPESWR